MALPIVEGLYPLLDTACGLVGASLKYSDRNSKIRQVDRWTDQYYGLMNLNTESKEDVSWFIYGVLWLADFPKPIEMKSGPYNLPERRAIDAIMEGYGKHLTKQDFYYDMKPSLGCIAIVGAPRLCVQGFIADRRGSHFEVIFYEYDVDRVNAAWFHRDHINMVIVPTSWEED